MHKVLKQAGICEVITTGRTNSIDNHCTTVTAFHTPIWWLVNLFVFYLLKYYIH